MHTNALCSLPLYFMELAFRPIDLWACEIAPPDRHPLSPYITIPACSCLCEGAASPSINPPNRKYYTLTPSTINSHNKRVCVFCNAFTHNICMCTRWLDQYVTQRDSSIQWFATLWTNSHVHKTQTFVENSDVDLVGKSQMLLKHRIHTNSAYSSRQHKTTLLLQQTYLCHTQTYIYSQHWKCARL